MNWEENKVGKIFVIFILISILFSPILSFSVTSITANTNHSNRNIAQVDGGKLGDFTQPIIHHVDAMDIDSNRIQDRLEDMISHIITINKSATLPVVVTLYNPVSSYDLNYFAVMGGSITHVFRYVTYGFSGTISAVNVSKFAMFENENLVMIEYDTPLNYHLDLSVPIIQARPTVWNTHGFTGSPNQSIAILDTGIDDSHPDLGPFGDLNFSRKIVGWYDATSDATSTPEDYGEHGTHVAAIAAGTGAANSLQASGKITTTFTYLLPPAGFGYIDYIDVAYSGTIKLNLTWQGNNDVLLRLYNPAGYIVNQTGGRTPPIILTFNTAGTSFQKGRYRVLVGNLGGPSDSPFSCIENYPYQGRNDGYNLFTGVAPTTKLVGVKVFDNGGSGSISTLIAGMEWIVQNKITYHIVVASMSLGLQYGAVDTTLDQKVDTLVKQGIVTIVSAGNDYPDYTIASPGTAAYAITVAATNDQNNIADYSSNGDSSKNEYGLIKPDVAAPGGTFNPQYGNKIISADSNDVDGSYSGYSDRNEDDYQQMAGTSMSAPHVAGLASLIIQALPSWNWTLDEALKVKMILGMTSFEIQGGEGANVPPLNRGDKDSKEGYGRISADAAIEAATLTYNIGETAADSFGSSPSEKKVWARQVQLTSMKKYEFRLLVPSGADYDLYLYSGNPDTYGQPIILAKSVNATQGAEEVIQYTNMESGTYYILAKWVKGSGTFNLQSESLPVPDVAVVNVLPSVASAFVGETVNITVTVKNEGATTESFDVTTHYNDDTVGTQTVTNLAAGTQKNLTFNWNTTNVTPCTNYTISAEVSVVPGEIDTADNVYVDGTVKIKIELVGDVNKDGIVDIADLATAGMAYQAKEGDPKYNPEADVNRDGIINVIDLALIGVNYGKTC